MYKQIVNKYGVVNDVTEEKFNELMKSGEEYKEYKEPVKRKPRV